MSKEVENTPCECDGIDPPLHKEEKENTEEHFHSWEDPETFLVALEKVEAWIFSRIVESVWWQVELQPFIISSSFSSDSSASDTSQKMFILN